MTTRRLFVSGIAGTGLAAVAGPGLANLQPGTLRGSIRPVIRTGNVHLGPKLPISVEDKSILSRARELGYNRIDDVRSGKTYLPVADEVHPFMVCYPPYCVGGGGGCQNSYQTLFTPFTNGPNVGDLTTNTYNCVPYAQGVTLGIGTAYLSFLPTAPTTIYSIPTQLFSCVSTILAVQSKMVQAAKYIISAFSKFPAVAANSARAALAKWGGTVWGVSAAAQFLGGLMAVLTLPEWLGLAAAILLGGAIAIGAWYCLGH